MKQLLTILLVLANFLVLVPGAKAAPVCNANSAIGKQLNLPIYEWVDAKKRRKGTIVAVHGLTFYAFCWNKLALHLAANGYRVLALDMRGFGRWRTESAKFGGDGDIEIGQSQQDLFDLLNTLRQSNRKQKLFCLGESLGANMSLLILSEHPDLADGAILASLCNKTRIHPKWRWTVDFAKEMVKPNKPLNLTPYAAPYVTNDPVLAKAIDNDPNICRKMKPSDLIKVDLTNRKAISEAKTLPADYPLLILAGSMDEVFNAHSLPDAIEKFGTRNVTMQLLQGKGHLLLEYQKVDPHIARIIDGWLKRQTMGSTLATTVKGSARSRLIKQ